MKKLITSITLLFFVTAQASFAHGGKLDATGCHKDKKTGTKHCHHKKPKSKKKSK